MATRRREGGTKDNHAIKRPSALFWRIENESKTDAMISRKKNSSAGGTINTRAKVKDSGDLSKENKVPTVNRNSHQRRPSLKELCPEDKARVKLLIEQLARTSSEKEEMEDRVKEERRQFTILLGKLKKQHHKVVKEKKELENELHASQLQLQASHTFPPSSATAHSSLSEPNDSPVKSFYPPTHLTFAEPTTHPVTSTYHHPPFQEDITPSAIHSTNRMTSLDHNNPPTSTNPVTSSVMKQIPPNVSIPHRGLNFAESSLPAAASSLGQATQMKYTALPSRYQHPHHSLSSTNATLSSIHAHYPKYFSTTSNSTDIGSNRVERTNMEYPPSRCINVTPSTGFGSHQTGRNTASPPSFSERNVTYPPSFSESLSTATGNEMVQQRSVAYPPTLTDSFSTSTVNQGAPLSSTHMHQSHQECQPPLTLPETHHHKVLQVSDGSHTTPSLCGECHVTSNTVSHDVSSSGHYPSSSPQGVNVLVDKTGHIDVHVASTSRGAAAQPWLSLPSATPDKISSHDEKKREILFDEEQSGGSRREIGTQTLYVESVSTQTDNEHKRSTSDPTIKETMDVLPSPLSPTKRSVDSRAMSVGELLPPSAKAAASKLPFQEYYGHTSKESQEAKDSSDGYGTPELSQSSLDEDCLMEELFTTSVLLNGHGGLSRRLGISQRSADFSSTSKRIERSTFDPLSPLELAASLNSQNDPSSLQTSPSQLTTHSTSYSLDSTPINYDHSDQYQDGERDSEKLCLDDSQLIEELFFI